MTTNIENEMSRKMRYMELGFRAGTTEFVMRPSGEGSTQGRDGPIHSRGNITIINRNEVVNSIKNDTGAKDKNNKVRSRSKKKVV